MDSRALLFLVVLLISWCCNDARMVITTTQSTVPEWEIKDEMLQHENEMGETGLCTFCKVVLVPIVHSLSNSTSQSEALSILHLICFFTFIAKDECNAIVDHYVPLIFNETSRWTPQKICTDIGLCINQTSDLCHESNSESYNNHQAVTEEMQIVHEKMMKACNSLKGSVNHYCKRIVMANALMLIPVYAKEILYHKSDINAADQPYIFV